MRFIDAIPLHTAPPARSQWKRRPPKGLARSSLRSARFGSGSPHAAAAAAALFPPEVVEGLNIHACAGLRVTYVPYALHVYTYRVVHLPTDTTRGDYRTDPRGSVSYFHYDSPTIKSTVRAGTNRPEAG